MVGAGVNPENKFRDLRGVFLISSRLQREPYGGRLHLSWHQVSGQNGFIQPARSERRR